MTTSTLSPQIAAFAAAVRTALADLPPEELDDLTDGLEADLAERAADGEPGAPEAELGDPTAYAEELRAAAGYPPRAARSHLGGALPNLSTLRQDLLSRADEFRDAHPLVGKVISFFVTLRPVWWVLRAWAIYAIVGHLFGGTWTGFGGVPGGPAQWGVLLLAIFVSVQLGRGLWIRRQPARTVFLVSSAVLAIALPFLVANAAQDAQDYVYSTYDACCTDPGLSAGLVDNGNQVTNIFAFDAQGNPIPQVQLFDQDGHPLNSVSDTSLTYSDVFTDANGDSYVFVPNGDVPGRSGWNVYPLGQVDYTDLADTGELPSNVHVTTPTAPFDFVKPLSGSEAVVPTPSPVETPPAE